MKKSPALGAENFSAPTPNQVLKDADEKLGISVYNTANPRAVANIVPDLTKAALSRIPDRLKSLGEDGLRKELDPDATLCRLRISFWEEYDRATVKAVKINLERVCQGVCTREFWDEVVILNVSYLAWVVTPPKDYMLAMKELLDIGMGRLREVLQLPFVDPKTGRLNPGIVAQVLAAIDKVDQRVNGAIVQRLAIAKKSAHVHAHTILPGTGGKSRLGKGDMALPPADGGVLSVEDEMAQLTELEKKITDVRGRLVQRQEEFTLGGERDQFDVEIDPESAPLVPLDPESSIIEADLGDDNPQTGEPV